MKGGTIKAEPIWEVPRSALIKLQIQLLKMRPKEGAAGVWGADIRKYIFNPQRQQWIPSKGAMVYAHEIDEVMEGLREAQKEIAKRIEEDATSEAD